MTIVKYVLIGLYLLNCLALIVIATLQSKEDTGASGAITGGTPNNFYEKNKGRTKEGKAKRWTVVLGVTFVLLTIGLGIVYVI